MSRARDMLWLVAMVCAACGHARPKAAAPAQGDASVPAAEAQPTAADAGAPKPSEASQPPSTARASSPDAGSAGKAKQQPADGVAADGGEDPEPSACDALRTLAEQAAPLRLENSSREYLLHVPAGDHTGLLPLVVDLHDLLVHARYQRAHSGLAAEAERAGFVVAYAQAQDAAWNLGVADCCGPDGAIDDLGFVRALVARLAQSGCIDAKRVYAVGSGVGGGLAQQLACRAPDLFAAVVTRDFDLLQPAADSCKPQRPIAVLALRSRDDAELPYAGGELRLASGLNARQRSLGAVESVKRWAMLDACEGEAQPAGDCQTYKTCMAGAEVSLCTRPSTERANDAATAWKFLQRFQLP